MTAVGGCHRRRFTCGPDLLAAGMCRDRQVRGVHIRTARLLCAVVRPGRRVHPREPPRYGAPELGPARVSALRCSPQQRHIGPRICASSCARWHGNHHESARCGGTGSLFEDAKRSRVPWIIAAHACVSAATVLVNAWGTYLLRHLNTVCHGGLSEWAPATAFLVLVWVTWAGVAVFALVSLLPLQVAPAETEGYSAWECRWKVLACCCCCQKCAASCICLCCRYCIRRDVPAFCDIGFGRPRQFFDGWLHWQLWAAH